MAVPFGAFSVSLDILFSMILPCKESLWISHLHLWHGFHLLAYIGNINEFAIADHTFRMLKPCADDRKLGLRVIAKKFIPATELS